MTKRIFIIVFFAALALNASAAAWSMRPDGTMRLQQAIDRCQAGDTLFLEAGTYREAVVLKDGVALIGRGNVILDGQGLGQRLISCAADCVLPTLVEHLILQNARHDERGGGAWLRGKVEMRHCVVRGCSGLQCGGVLIKGDLPEASALGAVLEDCIIHNCTATGHD